MSGRDDMRENFRRDKMKKEEMRKKKQEEKRNKRLNKTNQAAPEAQADPGNPGQTL